MPRRSLSLKNRNTSKSASEQSPQPEEEYAAVAGLLRTIQKPLSTIGRIFSDTDNPYTQSSSSASSHPASTPRQTPNPHNPHFPSTQSSQRTEEFPGASSEVMTEKNRTQTTQQQLSAEDAAARQASAETEEARVIQRQEHSVVVETLAGMFPQLDRDVIDDVVRVKQGRYVPYYLCIQK